jgi:DedD protein
MAERNAYSGELAVDELRRKARRRLIGAIVLALAAAIVVPMLLESDPRPLGDDVSVQIPSKNDGRFVNRLTAGPPDVGTPPKGAAARAAPDAEPEREPAVRTAAGVTKPVTAPTPMATAPKTMPSAGSASTPPASTPPASTPPASTPPASAANAPAPAPATAPTPAPASPASDAPGKATTATTATTAPQGEGFVVQLAAFADDKGANALANKLRRANYAAYVEPVTTSRGTLWRVRVSGYASRAEADAARAKLKDDGYSGIVAAAK